MHISRTKALELFKDIPECRRKLEKVNYDVVYFDFVGKEAYKSQKQNNLFHSLLSCFFSSGCASFDNYDEMRLYYKRVAGLVKPVGKFLRETSWADASSSNAKAAIDILIRDMDMAGVIGSSQGKKYSEILKGINQWYEF